MLATEDDCSGGSNSENRESIDGSILAYRGKTRFSADGLEDVGAVMRLSMLSPTSPLSGSGWGRVGH